MTKEKFSYALGNIGENYINEANAFSAKKKKSSSVSERAYIL